jgi:hypothetical protein
MSKVKIDYTGFLDTYPVDATALAAGWEPGNVGMLDSDGEVTLYDGSAEAMFILVDDDDELSTPPTGERVTVLYGQGKIVVQPASASDWTNVYVGPLTDWTVNGAVYATTAGLLTPAYNATPGAASGSKQVGKIVSPPTATNDYELTMLVTI